MRTRHTRGIALILVIVLLAWAWFSHENSADRTDGPGSFVAYAEIEYTRPDMPELQNVLEDSCSVAQSAEVMNHVIDAINNFYDVYDRFFTNYNLAYIRYSADLSDSYWEAEYNFCMENAPIADAGLEQLYRALAKSPMRDKLEEDEYFGADYFDAYEGEVTWDEGFLALLDRESELLSRYYDLSEQASGTEYYSDEYFSTYGVQLADLFVELIKLRQEIAAYVGYESYPEFAYDYYFYRDYTPAQAERYLTEISKMLYGPYRDVNRSDVWERAHRYSSEDETFRYVKDAASAMGGTVAEAFGLLEEAGLYDISYGEDKFDTSFELYLWSYYEPFVFVRPYMDQTDKLIFAHEFGHFINDYVCGGSYAGADVAEVHSQAFEYLSLCYGEDTDDLARYKMADSLCTYMESSAYALFEQQVYSLTGDDLTMENVMDLYERIGYQFGFDSWNWDSRDFTMVPHLFTDPLYTVGYVVSNDIAMQLYQMEQEEPGAGLALYERCISSEESYIIHFAETYGLESPFAEGRLQKVAATFRSVLG